MDPLRVVIMRGGRMKRRPSLDTNCIVWVMGYGVWDYALGYDSASGLHIPQP